MIDTKGISTTVADTVRGAKELFSGMKPRPQRKLLTTQEQLRRYLRMTNQDRQVMRQRVGEVRYTQYEQAMQRLMRGEG
jgi:hypothetical protein